MAKLAQKSANLAKFLGFFYIGHTFTAYTSQNIEVYMEKVSDLESVSNSEIFEQKIFVFFLEIR